MLAKITFMLIFGMLLCPHIAFAQQQCEHIDMSAEEASCDAYSCMLQQSAHMHCDHLHMWADNITIQRDADHQFSRAIAEGNVLLVEGKRVITCETIILEQDRIHAKVQAATIEIRNDDAVLDSNGVPQGRNRVVLHGEIERLDKQRIRLEDADMTLCDCGPHKQPSWRFDAASIEATLGERVLILWPQLYINPFGLGMVPITPPLAPLSLPLQKRAMGFLPPEFAFLRFPYPTIDIPFFIPLGISWDIKLAVGLRTDWHMSQDDTFDIDDYGAPRFGARLRYQPRQDTRGIMNFQITHDAAHGMAQRALEIELLNITDNHTGLPDTKIPLDKNLLIVDGLRRQLVDRVFVSLNHQTYAPGNIDFLLDARWISDDLVVQDFAVPTGDRYGAYMPSRTQLSWRHPRLITDIAADAMLRLNNIDPNFLPIFSNTGDAELGTMHRGPFVSLTIAPMAIAKSTLPPLHIHGSASFVRYGTWDDTPPHVSYVATDPPAFEQHIVGLTTGLSLDKSIGLLHTHSQISTDSLLVDLTEQHQSYTDAIVIAELDISSSLVKSFEHIVHVITPTLKIRSLPYHRVSNMLDGNQRGVTLGLDERLLRRTFYQGLFVLHQSFLQNNSVVLDIDINQPWDLENNQPLQPWGSFAIKTDSLGVFNGYTSLDYRQFDTLPVRELSLSWGFEKTWFKTDMQYLRMAPNADRFKKSIYELAAPLDIATTQHGTWAHLLRGGLGIRTRAGFSVWYGTAYQLRRPGSTTGEPECLDLNAISNNSSNATVDKLDDSLRPAACFTQHTVALSYSSPCNCWGFGATLSGVPQYWDDSFRLQFVINIGGYQVGVSPI